MDLSDLLPAAWHTRCGLDLPLSFNGRTRAVWFLRGACDLLMTGVWVGITLCCLYALYAAATRLLPLPIHARTALDRASRIFIPAAGLLYLGWLLTTRAAWPR